MSWYLAFAGNSISLTETKVEEWINFGIQKERQMLRIHQINLMIDQSLQRN